MQEWMLAKALWLHDERPDIYARTVRFVEYGDFLLERLTGVISLSANTATQRWLYGNRHGDQPAAVVGGDEGWPVDLFAAVGLQTLTEKLPPVSSRPASASRASFAARLVNDCVVVPVPVFLS
jgi:ribulose kinase